MMHILYITVNNGVLYFDLRTYKDVLHNADVVINTTSTFGSDIDATLLRIFTSATKAATDVGKPKKVLLFLSAAVLI